MRIAVMLWGSLLASAVFFGATASAENITSVLVEDFNEAWSYTASENLDQAKAKITVIEAGAQNDLLWPEESEGRQKRSMGFKCGFHSRGYNHVTFIPPKPITLPGRARRIQIWVMGMKYNYDLEIWVEDFRGMSHKLEMGNLNFAGWRGLTRDIPWYIPQQESEYPSDRPLRITKIVVRTTPDQRPDRFYVYFDQIRVLTDIYEQPFDGLELIKKSGW